MDLTVQNENVTAWALCNSISRELMQMTVVTIQAVDKLQHGINVKKVSNRHLTHTQNNQFYEKFYY